MKKELPINHNPKIKTFSYYGFPHAIIDNADYNNEIAAEISVENYERYSWENRMGSLELVREKDNFQFRANKFRTNMNACYYRECGEDDEIVLRLNFQQYSQPWGNVNIFLAHWTESNPTLENLIFCRKGLYTDDNSPINEKFLGRIGVYNKDGLFVRIRNSRIYFQHSVKNFPINMRIIKKKDMMIFRAGEEKEMEIYRCEIPNDTGNLKIGFQIELHDNSYYRWLYSNHIQLIGDINDFDCKLKYYFGKLKDYHYYTNDYFLNYNIINVQEYHEYGIDLLEFVKFNIGKKRYIETWLDHYYIEGQVEYDNRHFYHQFLIYGFDDESETINILGYNDNGILKKQVISYDHFKKCEEKNFSTNMLVLIEYSQDSQVYELNIEYVAIMVKQYLEGYRSDVYISHFRTGDALKFGIRIYEELLGDKGLWLITKDRRISFLLYEHKICMKERVLYLAEKGYISREDETNLLMQIEKIIGLAALLRNNAIKSLVSNSDKLTKKIKDNILQLREKDIEFMEDFYEAIVQYNQLEIGDKCFLEY